jgi:thioredoxin 1
MAAENVQTFTDTNFETTVLNAGEPVLVDFWAEWCQPCKALTPTIEAVALHYAGRLRVGKLNVDEHDRIANEYGVRSIPTLLIMKGGVVAEQRTGLISKDALIKLLDNQLGA